MFVFLADVVGVQVAVGLVEELVPVNLVELEGQRNDGRDPDQNVGVLDGVGQLEDLALELLLDVLLEHDLVVVGEVVGHEQERDGEENVQNDQGASVSALTAGRRSRP